MSNKLKEDGRILWLFNNIKNDITKDDIYECLIKIGFNKIDIIKELNYEPCELIIDLNKKNNFKKFDNEWLKWIINNLVNKGSREKIFNILLNHNFEYIKILKVLNYYPSNPYIIDRQYSQRNLKNNLKFTLNYNQKLLDNSDVYRIENNFLEIYRVPNFLSDDECDKIIYDMGDNFVKSSTVNTNDDTSKYRTNKTCHIKSTTKSFIDVNNKIHNFMNIPIGLGEGLQGQKYDINEEYKEHTDYFEIDNDSNQDYLKNGGQRTWTVMIYLNNVAQGGETQFILIDKIFTPKKGMAIIWNNLKNNDVPNPYSLHCGLPIIEGTKYIITKWFRTFEI